MVIETRGLTDMKRGLLDMRIYADEGVYQQELEKVFGRAWLLIGHDSLVPNPNDFFLTYMGEDPVILTRDAKGEVHAFLNMCRHRGNRVARADDGNAKNFMCTYHGWTYSNEGELVSVPGLQEAYYGELEVDKLGLVSVAHIDSYAGLIFATWDVEAPSLEDYLGDMRWYLDPMFNKRDNGLELVGPQKWIVPSNWKLPADNFAGDTYHIPVSHRSAQTVIAKANRQPLPDTEKYYNTPGGHSVSPGNGHGLMVNFADSEEAFWQTFNTRNPETRLREHYLRIQPEVQRRLGLRATRMTTIVATVFPNFSVHPATTVRMYHPRGPFKTELWTFVAVDKDAPEDVKRQVAAKAIRTFGLSGMFEQDDMDNWRGCTQAGRSRIGTRHRQMVSMGMGHERSHEILPGVLAGTWINETPQRGFYARWQEFMDAEAWGDIALTAPTAKYEGTATFRG